MKNDIRTIECPKCGNKIELTEALAGRLEADLSKKIKKQYELEFEQKVNELKLREEELNSEIENRLKAERAKLAAELKSKIEYENHVEIEALKNELKEKQDKLNESRKYELELRKEKEKLEEEKAQFELKLKRELDAAKSELLRKAKEDAEEEYKLQLREREETMKLMKQQIEELKRKAEQGSQQLQGEVQELELEEFLKNNFPLDEIIPVGKGQRGGDVIQKVRNEFGAECGIILWESKRTKNFSNQWIPKLKENQRDIKANVSVILSQVLPENINNFGLEDGVWICNFKSTLGLATALREQIMSIYKLRQSEVGKNQKMEALYSYLTSHEFAQRIETIIEAFDKLRAQIQAERKAFEKQWAAREKMLDEVLRSTQGMHGDLKGLIGASMPELPEADFLTLGEGD